VQGVAAALMLALFAANGGAATLSGTIVDYSNYTHGRYYVYLVRMNIDTPVVGFTTTTTAGAWSIHNVPNGHFFVLAWRDVNGNFVPSRGEPVGYYGVPFPSRVTVQAATSPACRSFSVPTISAPSSRGASATTVRRPAVSGSWRT
jgi:hypothetical protein